jgi:transketolase N-terminal domain/subunit
MTGTEPKDEKDPKRARVVLSKGHEVVGTGDSRMTCAAAMVMDRGENSGNHSRVSKTEQHYPSRVSRVGRVSRVSKNSSMD